MSLSLPCPRRPGSFAGNRPHLPRRLPGFRYSTNSDSSWAPRKSELPLRDSAPIVLPIVLLAHVPFNAQAQLLVNPRKRSICLCYSALRLCILPFSSRIYVNASMIPSLQPQPQRGQPSETSIAHSTRSFLSPLSSTHCSATLPTRFVRAIPFPLRITAFMNLSNPSFHFWRHALPVPVLKLLVISHVHPLLSLSLFTLCSLSLSVYPRVPSNVSVRRDYLLRNLLLSLNIARVKRLERALTIWRDAVT